ncbi:unnamed protein product [Pleuronectes platessa]|uniref:Uncharacterized protein n=1 Tax=Pleuronectes platessa TaxID=8262 RepID=A0A9N7VCC1_PLEPL|nr:unnamed protein product [Pleuronectes platessa]
MSRKDLFPVRHSYPAIPPAHTQTGGGVGRGLRFHTSLTSRVSLSSNYFNIIQFLEEEEEGLSPPLSDDVMRFFTGQQKAACETPQPPARLTIQDPSSNIPELRHVF